MYICGVYPAMLKSLKQLPYCLRRAETSVVLIVIDGVLCHVLCLCCCCFLPSLKMNEVPEKIGPLWTWSYVVGFTTTCSISAYHHLCCEFESCSWRGVLDTTLCDKVCQWLATGHDFLRELQFPPPVKLTAMI